MINKKERLNESIITLRPSVRSEDLMEQQKLLERIAV